jgi:hypothetical protein
LRQAKPAASFTSIRPAEEKRSRVRSRCALDRLSILRLQPRFIHY